MNSRERVARSIRHEEVDKIPSFYHGTPPINYGLMERFGINPPDFDQLIDRLETDVAFLRPRLVEKKGELRYGFSYGNVHTKLYGNGNESLAQERFALEDAETMEQLDSWRWPDPDWYDYEISKSTLDSLKGKAIIAYDMGIIFLFAMGIRGMEQMMIDMAGEPEMAHAIFSRVADFNYCRTRRFLEANKGIIDIVGIGDDIAGQNGLFFSISMWREYLKPHIVRMVELCREFNVVPYFHGCGGFRDLFPDLIEIGVECVGRLQTEAKGNGFFEIKKEFGRNLCLWGAIDGQHAVIEKSPEEVRDHVRRLMDIGSEGSGFIAGPTHSFTEDTPIENVLEVYSTLNGIQLV